LFFITSLPIDLTIQHTDELNRAHKFLGPVVHGVPRHQLATRDALEVFQADVALVAVLEDDCIARRHSPIQLFPQEYMNGTPMPLHGKVVIHLPLKISVAAQPFGADRLIQQGGSARAFALLELRFAHPPRRITGTPESLVCRHVTFLESSTLAHTIGGERLGRFCEAQFRRAAVGRAERPMQL
jgi:hypothetical protein